MQFEAKDYKNEGKGFEEVTGNFHDKFTDQKSPLDGILSWLIKKKKMPKEKMFFKTHFIPGFHVFIP